MKKVLFIILALSLVLGLAACGNATEGPKPGDASKKFVIGVSTQGTNNDWAASALVHFNAAFAEHKDQTKELIMKYTGFDDQQQIADIEAFITQGVDAMIVQPVSETSTANVIEKAKEKGIKVIVWGALSGTDKYDAYVDRDHKATGGEYAKYVVDRLGGKGNVIVILGYPGSGYSNSVLKGIKEVVDKNPGIKVLGEEYAEYTPDKAKQIVESYFAAGKQVDGIIVDGGLMGSGALEAFKDSGKTLVPMSCDDTYLFLNKAHEMGFTDYITCSSGQELAYDAVGVLFKVLNGEKLDKDIITAPQTIQGKDLDQKIDGKAPASSWYFSKVPTP